MQRLRSIRGAVLGACLTQTGAWAAEQQPLVLPSEGYQSVEMLGGLAMVLAAIFALAWAVRRVGPGRSVAASGLRVLGGVAVGARERVVLIEAGERQLLLGVAPGRVQLLEVLEQPLKPGRPVTDGLSFADRLRGALPRQP